jgi:hypothetical protein
LRVYYHIFKGGVQLKIIKANCAIRFRRVLNLDAYFSKIQTILSADFQDLNQTPYKDDAPADLPRFVTKSNYGHSQVLISLNQVVLNVDFDEIYQGSRQKVFKYMRDRVDTLFKIVDLLTDEITFSGTSVTVVEENCVKFRKFTKNHNVTASYFNNSNPYEYLHKYAFIQDKIHYLNITVSNPILNFNKINKVDTVDDIKFNNVLLLEFDVNDKHGFNYIKNYRSNKMKLLKNFDIIEDIIENNIDEIIECKERII